MTYVDANILVCTPVTNQTVPPSSEGMKMVPVGINFSTDSSFMLDLSSYLSSTRISQVQTIFIDNSDNGSSVTVTIPATQQRLICPANSQGYFPILCTSPVKLSFQSAGNVLVWFFLLNFPVAPGVWGGS